MNIFVSDECPVKSAVALDDKRLVKMVLETAQLLSSAVNLSYGDKIAPYKTAHKGHPCTLWTKQSQGNFQWLLDHGWALGTEYTRRYEKTHKSLLVIADIDDSGLIKHVQKGARTPFANCAANASVGVSFKHVQDTVEAYRQYLAVRWTNDKRYPTWTNCNAPSWIGHTKTDNSFFVYPETEVILNV